MANSGNSGRRRQSSRRSAGSGGTSSSRSRSGRTSGRKTAASKNQAALRRKYEEERRERARLYRSEAGVIAAFAAAALLLLSNLGLCGSAGRFFRSLQLGLFGLPGYVFPVFLLLAVSYGIANAGNGKALVKIPAGILLYLAVCGLIRLFTGGAAEGEISAADLYRAGGGGGVLGGLLCGALRRILGTAGAFLILAAVIIFMLVVLTERSFVRAVERRGGRAGRYVREDFARRREEHRTRVQERREERETRAAGIDFRVTEWNSSAGVPFSGDQSAGDLSAGAHPAAVQSAGDLSAGVQPAGDQPAGDLSAGVQPVGEQPEGAGRAGSAAEASEIRTVLPDAPETSAEESAIPASFAQGISAAEKNLEPAFSALRNPASSYPDEDPALQEAFRRADEILRNSGSIASAPVRPITAEDNTVRMQAETMQAETGSDSAGGGSPEDSSGAARETPAEEISAEETPAEKIPAEEIPAEGTPAEVQWNADAETPQGEIERADAEIPAQTTLESADEEAPPWEMESADTETPAWEAVPSVPAQHGGRKSREPEADGVWQDAPDSGTHTAAAAKESAAAEALPGAEVQEAPKKYSFPPLSLLEEGKKQAADSADQYRKTAMKLQNTLKSFGVDVTVTNYSCGPAVTRYELLPAQGVKVGRIVALADDIKLSLAAPDIRIEAPIPGKSAVGIEVPNAESQIVHLRDLFMSDAFRNSRAKIAFALGKDIGGRPVVTDISKMPHVLIAGATGSGKSVCINTLIMSILYRYRPDEVKLMMIDPKVVELSVYNGIPHLMLPVITDAKKAAGALAMAVAEMEDRYRKFASTGVRDLKGYNDRIREAAESGTVNRDELPETLPQIVIIIDELADLMMVSKNEVEESICRIAQLARAAGMHLVIATQRPSVNVITGLIKANIPTRIAFAVSSGVDSRTILDSVGAEKLLGKGDMLFSPQGASRPQRIQGAFVSDREVQKVVDFIREEELPLSYSKDAVSRISLNAENGAAPRSSGRDELFAQAGRFIIERKKASIGNLQRMFKIGFNRAARIMDQLCEAGVVGEEQGTKPREILMTAEQFEELVRQEE